MTSTDKRVTTDLIETLEDGRKGFASAAEKVEGTDRADLALRFRAYSAQRAEFSTELESIAAAYGDDIDEGGSVAGTIHRAWMAIKDVVAGSAPEGVLDVAKQGEDHAVSEFRKALDKEISPELRAVVERQLFEVAKVRDEIAGLQAIHS